MKNEIIVEAKDIKKSYGKKAAVRGVSFSVRRGEVFGILGPNGAGKTTTLEMIETLRSIDEGSVMVDGFDVSKDSQKVKYVIGVQPQAPAFMDKVTLVEQLEQLASAYGVRGQAKQLLKEVGLEDKADIWKDILQALEK